MSLTEIINQDIKAAMLAREKEKLEALRAVKAAILLLMSEKGETTISQEKELVLLNKLVKQRKEAADIYKANNRNDLYEKEMFEASVIEKYLPAQMTREELTSALKNIIAQTGAKTTADFGKVMGLATKSLAGKADGKAISEIVKQLLSS